MRYGLEDGQPKTLDDIGRVYGVTRERIRQIESKTMSKLRHPSRSQTLRDFLDQWLKQEVNEVEKFGKNIEFLDFLRLQDVLMDENRSKTASQNEENGERQGQLRRR